ncbi:hypothetical protein NOR51B_942 [Luminiphilus syltensis NOR5-1B]|uniref:Uncharacterized protein n=1 Tax=Luminiphilus syltensis NOR5-1B TaxID=565045 RepID=B8KX76_9GAMM|nr:hypothetical protein NOR51B_942 [Luminiphilus syltensis NOR5-1B]
MPDFVARGAIQNTRSVLVAFPLVATGSVVALSLFETPGLIA